MRRQSTRRDFLRMASLGVAATLLTACKPEVIEKSTEETVVEEKEVTRVVAEETPAIPAAAGEPAVPAGRGPRPICGDHGPRHSTIGCATSGQRGSR